MTRTAPSSPGELAGALECLLGVGDGLDRVEEARADPRDLRRRQGAGAAGRRGHERAAGPGEQAQHRVRVLVGQDRRDDDVVVPRQPPEQPLDPGGVVGAGEDVLADEVEAARERDLDVAV